VNAVNEHLSLSSSILLSASRAGLRAGQDNTVDVLLRVQAPDAPPATGAAPRPPQAVALVIDRSGSMDGTPLAEALRCAEGVATRLRASDYLALVAFDHQVDRLLPATPVGTGEAVRRALAGLYARGTTDLHGGWLDGARTLEDLPQAPMRRVILLSDGCANAGLTEPQAIAADVARWAATGITTSTFGLGRHFNEELMLAMARAGGGSGYYGDTAEDLREPFERELDLLANLCLLRPTFSVHAAPGATVECLNELPAQHGGWRLPDLAWGAEAWAVLRLTVPATALPAAGERLALLRVEVSGETVDGEAVLLERTGLALPVLPPAEWDALPPDALVARRLAELEAARLLARMRAAAAEANWDEVDRLLEQARRELSQHEWLAGLLEAMTSVAQGRDHARMMKEAMYSSDRLRSRLAAKFEMGLDPGEWVEPSFLRRKRLQGKDER
jgi:Ca-activated chloride channel homolog